MVWYLDDYMRMVLICFFYAFIFILVEGYIMVVTLNR